MKNFVLSLAVIALSATTAMAGGPVVVSGDPVVVNPPARGSVGSGPIIGVIAGLALICLIACGGSDSAGTTTEEDEG